MSEFRKEYLSESIADNLPGVIYRCNYDDNWTMYFISDYVEIVTGYSAKEVEFNRNISYNEIIHPEDRQKVNKEIYKSKLRKDGDFTIEYRIITKDGSVRWVWERGKVINDTGDFMWIDGIIFDITDYKFMQDQIKRETEQKQKFLRILNHDIRNPLQSMLLSSESFLHSLKKQLYDDAEKSAELFFKTTMLMSDFVENFLNWTKIVSGEISPVYENPELKEFIRESIEIVLSSAEIQGTNIEFDLPEKEIYADIDKTMFTTILWNLLFNAIKYSGNNKTVKIKLLRNEEKKTFKINVEDNGIGMKEGELSMIFNYSGFDRKKFSEKSKGFGLLLCKEFISLHNGDIQAVSEYNKGTTFYIEVPLTKI